MSGSLDMSLDDLIKTNKSAGSGYSRGRGRSSGPGPARRFPNRGANRSAPYSATKAPELPWQHDMFADQVVTHSGQAGRAAGIETGTKLYISNLDYGVSNEDIKELFAEVGDLKRHGIHYDRSGRSKGTAEIVFSRRLDALSAVKKYNNVQLDGKPMKIEIVGTNNLTPSVPFRNRVPRSGQGRGDGLRRSGGGNRGGREFGRGRGRGRGSETKVMSAEDLDADLEKYHSELMQIN